MNTETNSKENYDFDILEFMAKLWKYKLLIIISVIVFASAMIIKVLYFTSDTYTASGVLYIRSQARTTDTYEGSITKSEIDAARTLSTTYIETLKLRSFLTDVSEATGSIYSWQQIKSMMSVSAINDTEYISVSVTAKSPEEAYEIAECIFLNAPAKFIETFEGGQVTVVDPVNKPDQPNDKGLLKMILLGIIIGLAVGTLIVFIINLFDKKVHRSEDVERRYGVSILGEILQ